MTAETATEAGTSSSHSAAPVCIRFDGWTFDSSSGDLVKGTQRIRLQEQPLQLLAALLARPGQVVSREQLKARLWPRGIVGFDTGLNTAIRKLRQALDDGPGQPRYIETLPRKGYRFIGRIDPPDTLHVEPANSMTSPVWPYTTRALLVGGLTLMVLSSALLLIRPGLVSNGAPAVPGNTSPLVLDLYAAARTGQSELALQAPYSQRRNILDLVDKILAIDPGFAPAHVVGARARFDLFISNTDTSRQNLDAVRSGIDTAIQLSGDANAGLDVMMLYTAQIDLDPEEALRMSERAPADPDVMRVKATILNTMGRFHDSDAIFDQLLSLNPTNPRPLRIKLTNLMPTHRSTQALDLLVGMGNRHLLPNTLALAWNFTGDLAPGREPLAQLAARLKSDPDGEHLYSAWGELVALRQEGRNEEVAALLANASAKSLRLPPFLGAIPGAGRMPAAALSGWNAMLRGDKLAAASSAKQVQDFVASHEVLPWNAWFLKMLEAEAHVFESDNIAAAKAVREVLASTATHPNVHVKLYRDYLAACVLAWAGEADAALTLLENLWKDEPTVPPVLITRDPLFLKPLQENKRFSPLLATLEREIGANKAYFGQLQRTRQ